MTLLRHRFALRGAAYLGVLLGLLWGAIGPGTLIRASPKREVPVDLRLDWERQGLGLYLSRLRDLGDRVEMRFSVRLEGDEETASVVLGYPKYRGRSARWIDAVTLGPPARNRTLRVDRDGGETGGSFSVVVPRNATLLLLSVGDRALEIRLDSWFEHLERGRSVAVTGTRDGRPPPESPEEEAPTAPARLQAEVRWEGTKPFGDGALDAGESGALFVDVTNFGSRPTRDVRVLVKAAGRPQVVLPRKVVIPVIEPGQTRTAELEFRAGSELSDSVLRLTVEVLEEFGHDASPTELQIVTRAMARAELVVMDDFAVEGAGLPVPRDAVVGVVLRVRNLGQGMARGVVADVDPVDGVFRAGDGHGRFELGDLAPGEIAQLVYSCYANRRAEALEFEVTLSGSSASVAPARSTVTLPLEQSVSSPRVVRVSAEPRPRVVLPPPPPPLTSDIDSLAVGSRTSRPTALAVVIGVEQYASAPRALHASQDARTAGRYFERVLGIPRERTQLLLDREVTLAQFHRLFGEDGWLRRRVENETEVFVFFAGHGLAAQDMSPFLMPSDADLNYVRETGFSLDLLVQRLAELGAREVTLFLDACFSGLTRQGHALLAGARPLVLVPARANLSGIYYYSATTGAQIAHALDEQGHGLFTYYLFKGLGGAADLDGDRLLEHGELKEFLEQAIPREASGADYEQSPLIVLQANDRVLAELE